MPSLNYRDQALQQRSRLTARLQKKGLTPITTPTTDDTDDTPHKRRRRFPKKGESVLDEREPPDPDVDAFFITIFLFIAVFGFLLASIYVAPNWVSWVTGLKLIKRIPNPQVPEGLYYTAEAP